MAVDDSIRPLGDSPLDRVQLPVHTHRLILRRAGIEDADAIWAYRRQPEVYRWLTFMPGDPSNWREQLRRRLPWTLVIEHDGRTIGDLMVRVQDAWAQSEVSDQGRGSEAELGWVLDPGYVGHGYATEAVSELLRICFTELGLRRVVAHCFSRNNASWRLMERLGMRRETHTVQDSLHRDFGWLDGYSYALLASEWSANSRSAGPQRIEQSLPDKPADPP